ncbi:MAG: ferrous iron transport protein A [Planctomycetota bacterium]|nr:MAG: ferrous iron transport protein A [Planctomycetota bacterium]
MTRRTLADLSRHERATVLTVQEDGPAAERLRELGLCPGTEVVLDRQAPFGGPMVFRLRGYRLCLRPSEARRVAVAESAD